MNILLVEDNEKLANNVAQVLECENYKVEIALDGTEGLHKALRNSYDLILLDLALPVLDGIDVCKKIRENGECVPILMLTARIDLDSKVEGLDSGADDYLTKPFLMDELLARIRALLRRNSEDKKSVIFLSKSIKLDLSAKKLFKEEKEIHLSPTQMRILEYLVHNKGEVKKAIDIYESVWGSQHPDIFFSDSLKVHIARLRKKIGKGIIRTKKGYGYIIE